MQRKHNKEIVALAKTLRKNMTKEDLHKGHNPSVSSADSSLYTREPWEHQKFLPLAARHSSLITMQLCREF